MSAPKDTELPLPTESITGAASSDIKSESAVPKTIQAIPAVGPASADAGDLPPAKNVPLPQQDQNESEALDPQVGQSLESAEIGAEILEEAQVTQNPLEAEVRMQSHFS